MIQMMKNKCLAALLLAGILFLAGCTGNDSSSGSATSSEAVNSEASAPEEDAGLSPETEDGSEASEEEEIDTSNYPVLQFEDLDPAYPTAILHTSMGDIHLVLYSDRAPYAVNNFVTHAQEGYYDNVIFHRVINDFMIQGGDPTGTGMGGESVYKNEEGQSVMFPDEFSDLVNFRGALSMANSGENTNGSQFFIVQANESTYPREYLEQMQYPESYIKKYEEVGGTPHLDFVHTVFGMVTEGMDVVDAIAAVPVDENNKPLEPVVIQSITINIPEQTG